MSESDLLDIARDIDSRCRLRGSFTLRSGIVAAEQVDEYRLGAAAAGGRADGGADPGGHGRAGLSGG